MTVMLKLIFLAIFGATVACFATPVLPSPNGSLNRSNNVAITYQKPTVTEVKADAKRLATSLRGLGAVVDDLPMKSPRLNQVFGVQHNFTYAIEDLRTTSQHLKELGSFSEADGRSILSGLQRLESRIISAMDGMIIKKPALQEDPFAVFIAGEDLRSLYKCSEQIYITFFLVFPAVLATPTAMFKERLLPEIKKAVDAY